MTKAKKLYLTAIPVLAASLTLTVALAAPASAAAAESERYADVLTYSTYATETISYTNRNEEYKYTDGTAPKFVAINNMQNACGAVAGSEIVAYYDKYFPNLIPGYESYIASNGRYKPANSTYIYPMMQELYTLMQTNVNGEGVNESEFKSGLTQYINGKGYSVSYGSSLVSGSNFDYSRYKSAIDSNKVVALFSKPANVYTVYDLEGYDSITSTTIDGNHIMLAYGYMQINYYNASGIFRTDTYLEVSTGLPMGVRYYKINPHDLNAAYIITVS